MTTARISAADRFARKLDDYRQTAAARRSQAPAGGTKRWMAYGAAASAALVGGSAMESNPLMAFGIVYVNPADIVVPAGGGTLIDLDGNAVNDLSVTFHATGNTGTFRTGGVDFTAINGQISTSGTNQTVRRLASGQLVGTAGSGVNGYGSAFMSHVYTTGGVVTSSFANGFGTSPGFMGMSFDIGGNTHFAWLRVDVDLGPTGVPTQLTIFDWAYDDTPNTHIAAGAGAPVPEPASAAIMGLGLLALGASGVRRLRKSKSAEDQPAGA